MNKVKFQKFWEKFGTLCILILMFICFSIGSPKYFPKPDNLIQCLLQSAVYTLLAYGEFFAILLAGIDLSVGSVACFVGVIIAKLSLLGWNPLACILIGLLLAILLGAINGYLIDALDLVRCALRRAIADGNVGLDDLALVEDIGAWHLGITESHPACVHPECLGQQHQLLAIVADAVVQVVGFNPCHDQIIGHSAEFAVLGQRSLEGPRLILDELDVQPA